MIFMGIFYLCFFFGHWPRMSLISIIFLFSALNFVFFWALFIIFRWDRLLSRQGLNRIDHDLLSDEGVIVADEMVEAWRKVLEQYQDDENVFTLGRQRFNKKEILKHLEANDEIGKKIRQMSIAATVNNIVRHKRT